MSTNVVNVNPGFFAHHAHFLNVFRDVMTSEAAFLHLSHDDLDGVSCGILSSLMASDMDSINVVTEFTNQMVPETYNNIERMLYDTLSDIYNKRVAVRSVYFLITDLGGITKDELEKRTDKVVSWAAADYKDANNIDSIQWEGDSYPVIDINYVVIDHHQSEYMNFPKTKREVNSSKDYFDVMCRNQIPNCIDHNDNTTLVHSTTGIVMRPDRANYRINTDMYLCDEYCASMLYFKMLQQTELLPKEHMEMIEEYFTQVNEYDLGNQGDFLDPDTLDGLEDCSVTDLVSAILTECSPQMIINAALYEISNHFKGVKDDHGGHIQFCKFVTSLMLGYPWMDYGWFMPIVKEHNGSMFIHADADHIYKTLATVAVKELTRMTKVYDEYEECCMPVYGERLLDNSYIFTVGDSTGYKKYHIRLPEKYNFIVRIYNEELPAGVNTHVFAKKYLTYTNKDGITHFDFLICTFYNKNGLYRASITANPENGANCYTIAKLNNGGGHAGAAGFPLVPID